MAVTSKYQQIKGCSENFIKCNNAHSWVEVYFPEQGWVTFEPTKGFTNPAEFTSSDTKDSGSDNSSSPKKAKEKQKEEKKQPQKEEKTKEKREPAVSKKPSASHTNAGAGLYAALAVLAVLLVAAILLYVFRSLWIPVFAVRKLSGAAISTRFLRHMARC